MTRSTPCPGFRLGSRWSFIVLLIAAMAVGCEEEAAIRVYEVAKNDNRSSSTAVSRTSTAVAKDQRMLAAIVPNRDFAWFFKLQGEPEVVDEQQAAFRDMLASVTFNEQGQPAWKLSPGWQQQLTPSDITYSKWTHADSGLTATVTRLPFPSEPTSESWQGYVVSNVNRWRNQLALPPQSWDDMQGELEALSALSQGATTAYLVDLSGKSSGTPGMGPFMSRSTSDAPAAGTGAGAGAGADAAANSPATTPAADATSTADAPPATAAAQARPVTYTVPESWEEAPASGMRLAAFNIGDQDAQGEVTIIAAGGEIEANIAIWLGQVGVASGEADKQAVLGAAQELTVNGVSANMYVLDGPAPDPKTGDAEPSAEGRQSILVADIPWRENQSLFVKFKGPTPLAADHRETFVDFVESIQWPE